ncbi:Uncharacterised protein [Mycobacteroides abscessus subsp. massiliense]|nr:Uncharacterised protein [Mycobacteroides abscessus subsp. massiliense]
MQQVQPPPPDAIVDQNGCLALDFDTAMSQVQPFAPGELTTFIGGHSAELFLADPHRAHNALVDDYLSAAGDGTHRVLLVSGYAELTNHQHL